MNKFVFLGLGILIMASSQTLSASTECVLMTKNESQRVAIPNGKTKAYVKSEAAYAMIYAEAPLLGVRPVHVRIYTGEQSNFHDLKFSIVPGISSRFSLDHYRNITLYCGSDGQ